MFYNFPSIDRNHALANLGNCAAIRSNSSNKANAYEFIKILLSEAIQSHYSLTKNLSNIPIRKNSIIDLTEEIIWISSYYEKYDAAVFSDEVIDKYIERITNVDVAYVSNAVIKIFTEAMIPYVENELTYEECLDIFIKKLTIYASE